MPYKLFFVCMLLLLATSIGAKNCTRLGFMIRCDDGTTYRKVGNQYIDNQGNYYQIIVKNTADIKKNKKAEIKGADGKIIRASGNTLHTEDKKCIKLGVEIQCKNKNKR